MKYILIGGPRHGDTRDIDSRVDTQIFPRYPGDVDYIDLQDRGPLLRDRYTKATMSFPGRENQDYYMYTAISREAAGHLMWDLLWKRAMVRSFHQTKEIE